MYDCDIITDSWHWLRQKLEEEDEGEEVKEDLQPWEMPENLAGKGKADPAEKPKFNAPCTRAKIKYF